MSFLTAADVVDLTEVNLQGLATEQTVFPEYAVDVVFAYWEGGVRKYTAPQSVFVEYADRQEREVRTDSGETVTIDGWLTGTAPLAVDRGHEFSLGPAGDEESATVVLVRPARLGTQRAAFRLRLGEA